jgi:hypothetical protein
MDHHTRSLRDHRWDERPIEPHRRKQVLVQRPIPLGIVQHREAACRCRRAANDMDDDFYPTESLPNGLRDGDTAFGSRKIGSNKLKILNERTGSPACRGQNLDARFPERGNDRLSEAPCSAP